MTHIIQPRYEPGQRVDFVPRPGNEHGPGGKSGLGGLPEHHVLSAHEKAIQEGQGVRKRAVIDCVISETEVRLMLENGDLVWASPDEIQPLDSISKLGDLVGPASRSFKDALDVAQKETEAAAPPARFEIGTRVLGLLPGREWKVTSRAYNPMKGREQWEYDLEADDGLRQHQVAESLLAPADGS